MVKKNINIPGMILVGILVMAFSTGLIAREDPNNMPPRVMLAKAAAGQPTYTLANIGNWAYWVKRDGISAHTPTGDSGGIYPRSTSTLIYTDGLMWGGYVQDGQGDNPRTGGVNYSTGCTPGWVLDDGTPIDANEDAVGMYRIRADWQAIGSDLEKLRLDAAEILEKASADVTEEDLVALWEAYRDDWLNWPVDQGAPFYDPDSDGVYTEGTWDGTTWTAAVEVDLNGNGIIEQGEREEPGVAKGDQVLYWVVNDFNEGNVLALTGCLPMYIEVQTTMWSYNQPSAPLGQLIFRKFKFINKGSSEITDMYVSQWADPDIGEYTDDFAGCDTSLSLGFAYNAFLTDALYEPFNLPPGCVGYDFFQGPLVDGIDGEDLNKNGVNDSEDYGIFDLQRVGPGKINLPMTSFLFFAAGAPISDPEFDREGGYEWYNMLRGYTPTADLENPVPYIAGAGPEAGNPTLFPLAGDAFLKTGDIDGTGTNYPAGDRRIGMCSGPFTLEAGQAQEVVVAIVGGIIAQNGGDNRNAVKQMQLNDAFAQFVYDRLFASIPRAPEPPKVKLTNLRGRLALDWSFDPAAVANTEKDDPILGFNFEGYNVYQLPNANATIDQATKVATFDKDNNIDIIRGLRFVPSFGDVLLVPLQKGTNSGIQRYFYIEEDYLTGNPIYAGNEYYFAVTAYNFSDDPTLPEPALESSVQPAILVVSQDPKPGEVYDLPEFTNVIEVNHSGTADGEVLPTIITPDFMVNADYRVFFTSDSVWNPVDSTTDVTNSWSLSRNGDVLIDKSTNFDIESKEHKIIDGMQIKVGGHVFESPTTILDWNVLGTGTYYLTDYTAFGIPTGWALDFWGVGTDDVNILQQDIEFRFTGEYDVPRTVIQGTDTFNIMGIKEGTGSIATFIGARFFDLEDHPMKDDISTDRTADGYFLIRIPFEVWNVDENKQISFCVYDRWQDPAEAAGASMDWYAWNPYGRMYTLTAVKDYDGALVDIDGADADLGTWNHVWNISNYDDADWAKGDKVIVQYANPVQPATEEYTWSTKAMTTSASAEAADVEKVNVFPNPYYAFNPSEVDRYNRFVTFNNLPSKATIRIFNLAGVQVRKLEKNDQSQFFKWDLLNESRLPVASGMYIAYVDMPDVGKQKILKLFIVQPKEVLLYY